VVARPRNHCAEPYCSSSLALCPIGDWLLTIILINICYQGQSSGTITAKPIPNSPVLHKRVSQRSKYGAADRLLLAPEMILEKLVPGDILTNRSPGSLIPLRHDGRAGRTAIWLCPAAVPTALMARDFSKAVRQPAHAPNSPPCLA
jgi:hypothetical protein